MMQCPCYGCPDRVIDCHGKCEKYITYKAERQKRLHELRLKDSARSAQCDGYLQHLKFVFNHRRK